MTRSKVCVYLSDRSIKPWASWEHVETQKAIVLHGTSLHEVADKRAPSSCESSDGKITPPLKLSKISISTHCAHEEGTSAPHPPLSHRSFMSTCSTIAAPDSPGLSHSSRSSCSNSGESASACVCDRADVRDLCSELWASRSDLSSAVRSVAEYSVSDASDETLVCNTSEKVTPCEAQGLQTRKLLMKFEVPQADVEFSKIPRQPSRQALIIFDWDDTLLCSTFLRFRQKGPLPSNVERSLEQIEKHVRSLLMLASTSGQTFIFTNSEADWVQQSAARYLPNILPQLQHVRVISPRSRYQAKYPNDLHSWKTWAFLEFQQQLDPLVVKDIVLVGDWTAEMRQGAWKTCRKVDKSIFKIIKFQEFPTPGELCKQQKRLRKGFERIITSESSLKMRMRVSDRSVDKNAADCM